MKLLCWITDTVYSVPQACSVIFGLCLAQGHNSHTKISPLTKSFTKKKKKKKNEKKCEVPLATTLQKRPVKVTIYLGLDIIIKLKFTTNFDRCAIINVANCLTKKFES